VKKEISQDKSVFKPRCVPDSPTEKPWNTFFISEAAGNNRPLDEEKGRKKEEKREEIPQPGIRQNNHFRQLTATNKKERRY